MSTHPTTAAEILESMGQAGVRLDHIGACEAGAGNISVSIKGTPADLDQVFTETSSIDLPVDVPGLAGWTFFVTGSGCRLRDVLAAPKANVSALIVNEDGRTAVWKTAPEKAFVKPTSEFNSHLGVHEDQIKQRGLDFHVVIHAQPPYLVTLTHIPALRNDRDYNRAIMRWEPETMVQLPQGVKVLEYMVPGSDELGQANIEGLRDHRVTIWSKHGLMVRSDVSPLDAVDKVEYIEAGAMYEYRNLAIAGVGEGLHDEELAAVKDAFGVDTQMY